MDTDLLSVTTTFPSLSSAMPKGRSKDASKDGPSLVPETPVPATVTTNPCGVMHLILLFLESATKMQPLAPDATKHGSLNRASCRFGVETSGSEA